MWMKLRYDEAQRSANFVRPLRLLRPLVQGHSPAPPRHRHTTIGCIPFPKYSYYCTYRYDATAPTGVPYSPVRSLLSRTSSPLLRSSNERCDFILLLDWFSLVSLLNNYLSLERTLPLWPGTTLMILFLPWSSFCPDPLSITAAPWQLTALSYQK